MPGEGHVGAVLLEIRGLDAYYGAAHTLFDVHLRVCRAGVLAVLGRNGAGKSTLLKSIANVEVRKRGTVLFEGRDITSLPSFRIARLGIQLVPEDRRILRRLRVRDNLLLACHAVASGTVPRDLAALIEDFPALKPVLARRGHELSGGQQKIVALARALVPNPRLLLIDEPFEGVAMGIADQLKEMIGRLAKDESRSIVVAGQKLGGLIDQADRVAVLENGRVVFEGSQAEFQQQRDEIEARFLAV